MHPSELAHDMTLDSMKETLLCLSLGGILGAAAARIIQGRQDDLDEAIWPPTGMNAAFLIG